MALLMPSTNKNFSALADEAAESLFSKGVVLNESIATIAKRENLNPEEVKRLVEKANVVATVRMLRASTDRKATIGLANYDDVLQATHPVATVQSTDASSEDEDFQEKTAVLREKRRNAFMDLESIFKLHGQTKTAQEYRKNTSHVSIFKKRRELEEAKMKKAACEIKLKDSLDFLASEFCRYNSPDFEKFASEAIALHGKKALPIVNSLAGYVRCKVDLTKVAEHIIDDTTKLHRKMAELCSGLSDLLCYDATIETLSDELDAQWVSAKKGFA